MEERRWGVVAGWLSLVTLLAVAPAAGMALTIMRAGKAGEALTGVTMLALCMVPLALATASWALDARSGRAAVTIAAAGFVMAVLLDTVGTAPAVSVLAGLLH